MGMRRRSSKPALPNALCVVQTQTSPSLSNPRVMNCEDKEAMMESMATFTGRLLRQQTHPA